MNLDELFKDENDVEEVKHHKNIMIVDFSNILHSSYHGQVKIDKSLKDDKQRYQMWRFFMLNSLLTLKNKFHPDEIVLALDASSWRKKAFKYYKANRVLARAKQTDFNYKEFIEVSNMFIDELQETMPYKVIKVDNAEADDIVAILVHHLKNRKITIISRDKDFQQLLRTPNIVLFDPISKVFKRSEDPYAFLLDHIIRGDASDGIPNILSDDNVFVDTSKRQSKITKKVLKELYDLGIEEFVIRRNIVKNYERNKQLIELSKDTIPENIRTETVFQYNNQKPTSNFMKVAAFLRKHKIKSMEEKAGSFLF